MNKPVVYLRDREGKYTVIIEPAPDWEGFEKLIRYLQLHYETEILKSFDGPDARRWLLKVNGKQIELIHDDGFGNYFLAPTPESEKILDFIGRDLEERLKNLPEE